jgi:hypothetical protein
MISRQSIAGTVLAAFDPICGTEIWRDRETIRRGVARRKDMMQSRKASVISNDTEIQRCPPHRFARQYAQLGQMLNVATNHNYNYKWDETAPASFSSRVYSSSHDGKRKALYFCSGSVS